MAYPNERRARLDRRRNNQGPPYGTEERRKIKERRHIFVDEVVLSDSDWENYFHKSCADGGPPFAS